ncbi:MAG: hypothetical protein DMF53_05465 [Acidobacteria bacterium]|nr:MAG: hypothetical protein DMF53_05465 [Acidobacteriota bacterium]
MTTDKIAALLLERLEAAFGDLPVPDDEHLVPDSSGYDLERNQVQAKFRGRHWRSLSPADLAGEADSLALFTPEAFRFFLPAYVRASVLDYERADLIPMVVVWALARPGDPGLLSYFQSRIGALDLPQRKALKEFLSFLRERHGEDFLSGELDQAEEALGV